MYNGVRIIMKPPMYPCKLGLHIKMSMGNEHECFFGHLVDTKNPDPDSWQAYEIPLNLMHNDLVMSKVYQPQMDDHFTCNGMIFKSESNQETTDP